MADSDSDDDVVTGRGRAGAGKPKQRAHARWENLATKTWDLGEDANGNIEGVLGGIEEANKRRRYVIPRIVPDHRLTG